MTLVTKLTTTLGIKHPIIQGGMHYVGYAGLAAAVSEAGGLGIITALSQPSAEALRAEIKLAKTLTSKPLGVNLTLLPMLAPPNYMEFAQVVVDEKIPLVETAGHYKGLEPFIDLFKQHNIQVIHKCTAIRHAKTAQRMGVDMISMDGFECAGHPGESDVGNFVLLAKAARELGIPFIASGGVADGKQLAAALALGAEGVNMGTRFLATVEAPIHKNVKQAIVAASELDTVLVMRAMRNTERVFKNKAAVEVVRIEKEFPGDFSKIQHLIGGKMYKDVFQKTGNIDEGVWSVGQNMGLIDDVPTCKVLLERMVKEAEDTITSRLAGMVSKL